MAAVFAGTLVVDCDTTGPVVLAFYALLLGAVLTSGLGFHGLAPRRPLLAAIVGGGLVGVFTFFGALYIGLFRGCGIR